MKLQWKYYVMKKALTIENRDYYCNPMITFKPENYAKKQNLKINHLKDHWFSHWFDQRFGHRARSISSVSLKSIIQTFFNYIYNVVIK